MQFNNQPLPLRHSTQYYEHFLFELKEKILQEAGQSISSILAFGGAAREAGIIPGWSDLDILIVSTNTRLINKEILYNAISTTKGKYGVPTTIVLISEAAVEQRMLRVSPSNSVILNALSGRPQTAKLLSGYINFITPSILVEKANALSYLDHMTVQIRRHLLEGKNKGSAKEILGQAIRWTSSILRATLRCHGVFVLPYEETLTQVATIYPNKDLSYVASSFDLRYSWDQLADDEAKQHLHRLDYFIEDFLESFFASLK